MINLTQEEIMQNWSVNNRDLPLVSVICCTYNHEPYIAQALDGFLMQKTSFPFEVLVNDDASTDKTANIIKEYEIKFPSIIKPIYHSENEYSQGIDIFGNLVKIAKGKYIAICEGDDYWIDEKKLQMQADFLEKNLEYGMCYSKTKIFIQKKKKIGLNTFGYNIDSFNDLLVNGNKIPTLTAFLRHGIVNQYYKDIKPAEKKWLLGDYPLWLYFSKQANVKFMDKTTSVYRLLEESASHSNNLEKKYVFEYSYLEVKKFFIELYNTELGNDFYFSACLKLNAKYYYLTGNKKYRNKMVDLYALISSPDKLSKIYMTLSGYPYLIYKSVFLVKEALKTLLRK